MNEQKRNKRISTSTMTVVALMAAVLCVLAPFSIPLGPVPISLVTLGLYLAVIILGGKNAGIKTCRFNPKGEKGDADFLVQSLSEIPELLKRL
jgi:hypothetical protein